MKVLRAHDYPQIEYTDPDFRALRRILFALFAGAFLCLCMVIALIPGMHPKPARVHPRRICSCQMMLCCTRQLQLAKK
jgi:hypothetical protein